MACGKKIYPSKAAARRGVMHMHESVRVYPCSDCNGGWHTTQQRYRPARKRSGRLKKRN
jgi:hypothetical protein